MADGLMKTGFTLQNLEIGETYDLELYAFNGKYYSDKAKISIRLTESPATPSDFQELVSARGPTSVKLNWQIPYFGGADPKDVSYTLFVLAQDDTKERVSRSNLLAR